MGGVEVLAEPALCAPFVKNFRPSVTSMTMPSNWACSKGIEASYRPAKW